MNFNVYIDNETGKRLSALAERLGQPRNALVREALGTLLDTSEGRQWPDEVLAFEGESDFVAFEQHRAELAEAVDDPLAAG